ncbi:hypothetical protein CHUAL_003307 [Chamberlinius hualienensis]
MMKTIFVNLSSSRLQYVCETDEIVSVTALRKLVAGHVGVASQNADLLDIFFCRGGHILRDSDVLLSDDVVHACPRLRGGKGGFGSMLRAIGAQIEKTTNREACRDLSGRRLRDINEETRLKKWMAKQAEEKQDKDAMKIEALEKKLTIPKHEFSDPNYDKERSNVVERVNDAVAQGLALATSSKKRPADETTVKTKKPKLWFGADEETEDSDVSSSDDDSDASSSSGGDSAKSSSDQSKNSSSTTNNASTSKAEEQIPNNTEEKSSAKIEEI